MIVCLLYFAVYLLICLITSVSMVAIQQLPVDSDTKINTKTGQEISGTWCTARWSTWTNNYQMEEARRQMSCIFCEMIDEWIYILYKYYTVAYWFHRTNHSSQHWETRSGFLVLEPEAKILEVVTTQRDKGYHTFLESYKCLFSNAV